MPNIYQTGGYQPPEQKSSPSLSSLDEREEILHCLVSNQSILKITRPLSKSPSTISWKIKRNGGLKPVNDNSGDYFIWQKILNFGVEEHQIGNQSVGFQTSTSAWTWSKDSKNDGLSHIYGLLEYAE